MSAQKKYDCKYCHITDAKKFTATKLDTCKECKIKFAVCCCDQCGDTNRENFDIGKVGKDGKIINRYSKCRKCRNKASIKCAIEKEREDKFDALPYDKVVNDQIKKFVWTDLHTVGKPIKSVLEEHESSIGSINKREENYQEAYESLAHIREEFSEIKESHAKLVIEINNLKIQNTKIVQQNAKIAKQANMLIVNNKSQEKLLRKMLSKKKLKFLVTKLRYKKRLEVCEDDNEKFY